MSIIFTVRAFRGNNDFKARPRLAKPAESSPAAELPRTPLSFHRPMPNKDRNHAVRVVCNELNHLGVSFNPPLFKDGNPRPNVEKHVIKTLFAQIDKEDRKDPPPEPRVDRFVRHVSAAIPWHFRLMPSNLIAQEFRTIGALADQIMES